MCGYRYGMKKAIHFLGAATILALGACSANTREAIKNDVESATNSAAETAARNFATQQGEEEFKNSGNELSGPLTCSAKVKEDAANVVISCTGTTKAGGAATLLGTSDELPGASVISLNGQFVGAVDGVPAFEKAKLGG
jgi:hypothetical protein